MMKNLAKLRITNWLITN